MLHDEQIITFSEAAKSLPAINGRKPHASTIWRWARKGVNGIRLETRRLGGRFVTSLEALERFSEKLAGIDVDGTPFEAREREDESSGPAGTSHGRIGKAKALLSADKVRPSDSQSQQ